MKKTSLAENKAAIRTPYLVFYKTSLSRTAITQRENNRKVVDILKIRTQRKMQTRFLNIAGFDPPAIVEFEEISKNKTSKSNAITHHDWIPEIFHPNGHQRIFDVCWECTDIKWIVFAERIVAAPGCTGIEETDHLEIPEKS